MKTVYFTRNKPARTAKLASRIWDYVTRQDGKEPQSLGLFVSEGGFRDWLFVRANGELDQIEAGIINGHLKVNYSFLDNGV